MLSRIVRTPHSELPQLQAADQRVSGKGSTSSCSANDNPRDVDDNPGDVEVESNQINCPIPQKSPFNCYEAVKMQEEASASVLVSGSANSIGECKDSGFSTT